MTDFKKLSRDYKQIEQAIKFIEKNFTSQPTLVEIAESVNLSQFHFQKLFSNWVGISPKRFMQFLTKEYAKKLLEGSNSILDVACDAGLSSPGRLHDLFVTCEALSPGEYKNSGRGISITYGIHPTPFGDCLIAATERGVCNLKFEKNENHKELTERLYKNWPEASFNNSQKITLPLIKQIFNFSADNTPPPLHLYVKGTNFQIKVWEALLKIPVGKAVTYSDIARHIGAPKAARAVGNAVGQNPIPFLIPCHRVIKKIGDFGNYGAGPARKKAILGWEAVQNS